MAVSVDDVVVAIAMQHAVALCKTEEHHDFHGGFAELLAEVIDEERLALSFAPLHFCVNQMTLPFPWFVHKDENFDKCLLMQI